VTTAPNEGSYFYAHQRPHIVLSFAYSLNAREFIYPGFSRGFSVIATEQFAQPLADLAGKPKGGELDAALSGVQHLALFLAHAAEQVYSLA
jgi:hypothetical protein